MLTQASSHPEYPSENRITLPRRPNRLAFSRPADAWLAAELLPNNL